MSLTVCGYCASQESHFLYSATDMLQIQYEMRSCKQCQSIFLSPRPDSQTLAAAYSDAYYGTNEQKFSPLFEQIIDLFRSRRAKNITQHLQSGDKVLDIGCGNGNFLRYVRQQGNFDIYGIELPGKRADIALKVPHLKLKCGVLESHDFPPESLAAVTMFHVFEHLTEPQHYLHIIQQILRPDGLLVVSFPNIDSWQSRWFRGHWFHLDPPRHLFFMRPKDCIAAFKQYGFVHQETSFFSIEYNPFGFQQSLLNLVQTKRELLYEYFKKNKNYTDSTPAIWLYLQYAFFLLTFPLFIVSDLLESWTKRGATVQLMFRKKES